MAGQPFNAAPLDSLVCYPERKGLLLEVPLYVP